MTLATLNECDQRRFVGAVGWVFEHSPWVAERAWRSRPFGSVDELHNAMTHEMFAASPDDQLTLVRAHPDLGARARMSDASTTEQSGAGLDRLTPFQYERLLAQTSEYRRRFGFPFLYAVKGSTIDEILAALDERMASDPAAEFNEALRQVMRIARFRLDATVASA